MLLLLLVPCSSTVPNLAPSPVSGVPALRIVFTRLLRRSPQPAKFRLHPPAEPANLSPAEHRLPCLRLSPCFVLRCYSKRSQPRAASRKPACISRRRACTHAFLLTEKSLPTFLHWLRLPHPSESSSGVPSKKASVSRHGVPSAHGVDSPQLLRAVGDMVR